MTRRAASVLGRSTVSVCLASLFVASVCAGDLISIDGFFDDWAAVPVAVPDPEGDGTTEDIALLRITNDSSSLFLDLAFHNPEFTLRSQNSITLYIDTDEDTQTGLAIHGIGAELEWCLGCASGVFHQAQGAENLGRNDFEMLMAPAYTSRRFELALSLASDPLTLNGTQVPGRLSIVVAASGQGDFLPDAPVGVEYVIDSSPLPGPPPISLTRFQEGHLRLMSYNTEFSGILDPERQPFFERIIKALNPDIMAFQELRNAAAVRAVIAEWLQVPLFSVEVRGNTLVSRFPILDSTVLIPSGRSSAVLLDTQAALGTQLLVLNTHLIPFNDAASQQDADELIRQLRAWRDGDGPFALAPNTPIFNVGDFNLFGPSQLLKTMSAGDISDENQFGEDFSPDWDGTPFLDLNSLQTGRRVSFTTSGSSGGVKLDYVFYSNSVIKLGNHYVLNTARMSPQDLLAKGLQAQDTGLASDHLPRVVDVASISDPGSSEELYFAQFGNGAGLFSQIILFNLDRDSQANVSIVLRGNDGNLLSLNLNGELVTGEKTVVIPAGGLRSFKTDGLGDLLDGSVTVTSDQGVAGVILFGGPTGLAGVGSSSAQPHGFTAPMETNSASAINTGIAVMNLEEDTVNLDLQLCDRDGAVLASAAAVLPGMGHVATFLSGFAWSPAVGFSDFEGILKVTADGSIAATVIQTRPGQFATLPVVPLDAPEQTASELVLVNGTILTLDKDDSIVSSVKIRDGRIVAVGDDAQGIATSAQVIDLGGRVVTPGLIDSHIHYFRDAHVPGHLLSAIETVFTIPDLLDALAVRAASVPAGEFITVLGRFTTSQFAENRLPTLAELDGAAPDHPVYLHSGFSGPAVTNTLGRVFFEARGVFVNQSGSFSRGQTDPPVQALFADYTNAEALRTVREYMQFSASLGLTTIQNFSGCGGFGGQVRADILCEGNFYDLWQQGALRVRIRTSAGGFGNNPGQNGIYPVVLSTEEHLQELQDLGGGDDWLRFVATGEFVVGNFGSTSAPFAEAYLQIAERGWSLRQHSISSGENEAHISGFESVNATVSIADLRWAVEHVFVINADHRNRLKEIGAGVTVQNQQYLLGGSGPPYRDLVDSGILIGGGTDASAISPMSPWISLYHMVTGKDAGGNVINAGQQIGRMEALRLYTTGSAYYTFDDKDLGSIEVGKLGDLVVLSDDYLSVPEDEIRTLGSVLTIIGGEVVHAAGEFANLNPLPAHEVISN